MTVADDERSELRIGYLCTTGAFAWWGMVPLFIKQLGHVDATEILVHRVIWTMCCVWILIIITRQRAGLRALREKPSRIGWLCLSGILVGLNWLTFTWAVNNDRILDTSMGYYINPLLSVLLGVVVLREHLRPLVKVAVGLAFIAVVVLIATYGRLPWVSLTLATTFAFYGLIRKQVPVDPATGVAIETTFLLPFALAYGAYLINQGTEQFVVGGDGLTRFLLLCCGPVTMSPLLMFSAGARRLPLSTVGILQYLAPSMTFLIALIIYKEDLSIGRVVAFALIWSALTVFTTDSIRFARAQSAPQET